MNCFFNFAFCILCVIHVCVGSAIVTRCAPNDLGCLKRSAQALLPTFVTGIPQLNVKRIDPLVLPENIESTSSDLRLTMKNLVVTGLKGCVVEKIERDVAKSKMLTRLLCTVRATGDYEMNGSILMLPIQGKGKTRVVLNKMQLDTMNAMEERIGSDSKKHWHIKSFRFSYQLDDKASLKFENLFNGNQVLARAAEDIINSSPNEIVMEIGTPIIKRILEKIIDEVNNFYKAVPVEDLALD